MKRVLLTQFLVMLLFSSFALAGSLPVDITLKLNGVQPGGGYNGWATGEYVSQIGSPSEYVGVYAGFCVDPAEAPTSYQDYELVSVPDSAGYKEAAYIFNTYGTRCASSRIGSMSHIWPYRCTGSTAFTGGCVSRY